ncbi:MAG: glycine--tRNA ligase [candidate division Zixibacteria bacterium]|nr:glycine--tRNA ligase [candidate division Zixibacteria bacterium]
MEKLNSLCKRRGFIFQSSEIYGGINALWDYGPMGVEMKRNIKNIWWESMTQLRDDVEGIDAAILMHPQVWETSGHVQNFTDPLVDCKKCKQRFRADLTDGKNCPNCGGELTEARQFNLMFKTHIGALEEEGSIAYLRPETAQGIYVNFLNVLGPSRQKVPFGIAQIGKAFRNEISPGNFIFRSREFEQMEMQFFVDPQEDEKWMEYWRNQRMEWYLNLGIKKENLRFHQHGPEELAHYAKAAYDIEYQFPFSWKEIEGIHNRTDFDLSRHSQASGKDLSFFDEKNKKRFVPYIIETSAGVDRSMLVFLADAYHEEEVKGDKRVVLKLHPKIAPVKIAILPLVNRENMPEIALKIFHDLKRHFKCFYDDGGAVGRRYRRQDEIGTPYAVTVDSQTLQDQTVTIRVRDSMQQSRVKIGELLEIVKKKLE